MTTPTLSRPRPRLVRVGVVAGIALVLLGVLAWVLLRPGPAQAPAPSSDVSVQVAHWSYDQRGTDYTITSVEAFTRGDEGYVRLHLLWSENPDDSSDVRYLPAFGAEVLHREPYAGATAACGLSAATTVPADSPPTTVEMPCSGLLVPEDVAQVTLHD